MVKAVLFDLDGVLINSEIVAFKSINKIAGEFGHSVDIEEYTKSYLGRTVLKSMEHMVESFNLPISVDELYEKYLAEEEQNTINGIELKPYAEEVLKNLKGRNIKTIVASSSSRKRAETILNDNGVLNYFDDLIFGYEVPRGKPYPDIFIKACEKLGVKENEAVVIEDSEAGIDAAHSAKIAVICVVDMKVPDNAHKEKCVKVVSDLKEAEEIIYNL